MSTDHASHPHANALRHPDGSWIYTNALARETSPYLLQHAHNPVDWLPWGPAAFDLARKLEKPIFLSVGYSTCYWCHVMERQCFEDPEIAAIMNEHFVNIKVDREERPDVDDIYMMAVQVLTGRGGWPMSVFLTPPGTQGPADKGLKPFYAGTYFPPRPAHGMPSFPQVLQGLSHTWKTQRSEIIDQGKNIAESVTRHISRQDDPSEPTVELVQKSVNALLKSYDPDHGGFGSTPKFPTPANPLFLLKVYQNNAAPALKDAIVHTLDRMARGGMYDQIGGGFHRYSTDEKWLVPHFEKMLYDNGQLVEVYLTAHALLPDAKYPDFQADLVRQTCDYVLREMTDPTGAFWSAQDAEVEAMEGGNYLWTPDEIHAAIGDPILAGHAIKLYGLDLGTNFQDPHAEDAPPTNVVFQPLPLAEFAGSIGATLNAARMLVVQINHRLLSARYMRKQPGTDDKTLVAWNGMMIGALAMAGRVLNEPMYAKAAARAATYILEHMRTSDAGLYRTMRQGHAKIPAFLDDYAFLIHGLLQLHRADHAMHWLDSAIALYDVAAIKFKAPQGGYFDTLADQSDLFVRTRSTYDGAIPTGNSQMVHDLIDLFEITKQPRFLEQALIDLRSFADPMRRSPAGMTHMNHALLRVIELVPGRFNKVESQTSSQGPDSATGDSKPQVVSVEFDQDTLDLSTRDVASLKLKLILGPDYHVNSNTPSMEELIPTRIELIDAQGLELQVDYPVGKKKRYDFADQSLDVYEGETTFNVTVIRTGKTAPGTEPKLVLTLQLCTDMSCLQPRSAGLPIKIIV